MFVPDGRTITKPGRRPERMHHMNRRPRVSQRPAAAVAFGRPVPSLPPVGQRAAARRPMLPDSLVFSVAVLVAAVVVWRGALRRAPWRQVALQTLLVVYVAWIVSMTLFPVPLDGAGPIERVASELNRPNVVPLHTIRETLQLESSRQRARLFLGNILVFVPFGLLMPVLSARVRSWPRALLAGLAFSGSIELAQLAVSLAVGYWYRMPDVDDLLLNVVGVLLGYALFVTLGGATSRSR